MTEINMKVLEMIKQNYSIDKICEELNISKKQLKRRIESIKNEGYIIKKMYGYNRNIRDMYHLDDNPKNICDNTVLVKIADIKKIKMMAISDTHIGNNRANMDYIKMIYEHCSNNNIPIVLHCGDLLEGKPNPDQPPINLEKQLDYLIKKYPYDSNINTFVTFGNHDESFIKEKQLDIRKIIEKQRNDIIPLGYNEGQIKILNSSIHMTHNDKTYNGNELLLLGHSHKYKVETKTTGPRVTLPTLSDVLYSTDDYPGAIEIEIGLNGKLFDILTLKHLIINEKNKVKKISEFDYRFRKH